MEKQVLVVERNVLFKENYFNGFLPADEYDYLTVILGNFQYKPRGEWLEKNRELKQIIPYVWIVNKKTRSIFVYQRATSNYAEARLRNKWSCGVGGHIERIDSENPVEKAMMRELQEEIKMPCYPKPKIIGYLNEDETNVGEVHFGVVAIAETDLSVEKGNDEIAECRLVSISELKEMFSNPEIEIEGWTKSSWPFVKDYMLSNN